MDKDAQSGNVARLRADIARSASAADKMRRLLDDLLDLSRVGRMTNPLEMVAFDSVVREALANVQGHVAARRAEVTVAHGLPLVHVERARIVQVLQNLLEKATKFTGE